MTSGVRMALPSVMRAIRLTEFGGPELLKVSKNVAIPKPGQNEVFLFVYLYI